MKMKAMGAFITSEANSMSAIVHRKTQADKAMRKDMRFHKNKGTFEGRRHERYRGSLWHTGEIGSWTKEFCGCISRMGQHESGGDRCKKLAEENGTARLVSVIGKNLEACTEYL